MTSEDSFHDRIEDELAALRPPPIGGLAGEALERGRRIRRRERAFGMAGGTAAVAGVVAAVVALNGGFGAGGGTSGSVGPGAAGAPTSPQAPTPTPTPTPTPSPDPSTSSSPSGAVDLTAPPSSADGTSSGPNTVIGTIPASWQPPAKGGPLSDPTNTDGQSVAELVLDGLRLTGSGTGSDFSGSSINGMNANATLTWSTQHGSIRISASVSNDGADGKSTPTPESLCHPMYETDYCAAAMLSDGSVVEVSHGTGESGGSNTPTHDNAVMLYRPDHTAINVVEWSNGPLTDDQLYKIVSDPRWGLKMDGSFVANADRVIRPFSG
ncbi:hypothetical protein ABH926_001634 [Catenulispora sp. GP43]|uniref:hypothetical protein n=1 Tax=Catenulispora sp. GP43 TaxID=3156263 RepID=UPI003516875E